eukprot:scaffold67903_cov78-Cyclotella_meneghiniana.AAC.2
MSKDFNSQYYPGAVILGVVSTVLSSALTLDCLQQQGRSMFCSIMPTDHTEENLDALIVNQQHPHTLMQQTRRDYGVTG